MSDGGAGGQSLPGDCPADLRQMVPARAADCPDMPFSVACDWTENAICVWQDAPPKVGFLAQGCYAAPVGKMTNGGVGQTLVNVVDAGVNNDQCPKIAPVPDTSCAMHAGQHCYYPLEDCACGASEGNWQCHENANPTSPPIEVKRLCAPLGIDETKQLSQLSDEEVRAWCDWYADPSGAPRPTVSPQDPPDLARSYASLNTNGAPGDACILELPAELCVKNIRTQPACTATLAELDDCVETIRAMGGGGFVEYWVGHGCAPLMANPTCSRVIAQPINPEHPTQCEVPLQ